MKLTKIELKELKNSIERIEAFEEKLGMRIENISMTSSEDELDIHGDFFMEDMSKYIQVRIVATIYDEDNDILGTKACFFDGKDFLGFETFTIKFYYIEPKDVKKIRLYPKVIKW